MPEPITTVGLGLIAAYLGKDGLQKLLGPTADYLGQGLKDLTKKRFESVGKILENASEKLGDKIDAPGSVPPKVLKHIIDDGSFADDKVEIEYLGGVLASSRSADSRDNRGAAFAKLVDSLSNYQIAAHFLIYSTIRSLFAGTSEKTHTDADRRKLQLFLPAKAFVAALEFSPNEIAQMQTILNHTFFGLHKEGLIEGEFTLGPGDYMQKYSSRISESGIVCQPSALGIELFLWAFGAGKSEPAHFFASDFCPRIEGMPSFVNGSFCTRTESSSNSD